MQKRCNGAKRNGVFSKCLQWICQYYAFRRNATTSKSPIMAKLHPAGMHLCYAIFCRHFASVMLHIASLISHNLRCIPAYTHLIPTGFFQSSLNNHRDNFYIFFHASLRVLLKSFPPESHQICTKKMQFPPKTTFF